MVFCYHVLSGCYCALGQGGVLAPPGAEGRTGGSRLPFPVMTAEQDLHTLAPLLKKDKSTISNFFADCNGYFHLLRIFRIPYKKGIFLPTKFLQFCSPFSLSLSFLLLMCYTLLKGGLPMKKTTCFLFSLLLFLTLLPIPAAANSAEPPCFTILVLDPPQELDLSVQLSDGGCERILLQGHRKGWEGYYRFYYSYGFPREWEGPSPDLTLLVSREEGSFQLPLSRDLLAQRYNNILTLDLDQQTLTSGEPAWRGPLLVGLRVTLTLLIEGAVLYLMGYRQRKSWLIFLLVNLITQGGLNLMLNRADLLSSGAYWVLGYGLMELIIFLAEAVAYALLLREKGTGRAVAAAFTANAASLVLGGFLLSQLPI